LLPFAEFLKVTLLEPRTPHQPEKQRRVKERG
jgi:hypothetical protein